MNKSVDLKATGLSVLSGNRMPLSNPSDYSSRNVAVPRLALAVEQRNQDSPRSLRENSMDSSRINNGSPQMPNTTGIIKRSRIVSNSVNMDAKEFVSFVTGGDQRFGIPGYVMQKPIVPEFEKLHTHLAKD